MLFMAYAGLLIFHESFLHDFLLQMKCKGRALLLTVQKRKICVISLSLVFPSLVFHILLGMSELIRLIRALLWKKNLIYMSHLLLMQLLCAYPCMCTDTFHISNNCLKDRTPIYWTTAKHSPSSFQVALLTWFIFQCK